MTDERITPWVIVGCGRLGTALAHFAAQVGIPVAAAWDRDGPPDVPADECLSGTLDVLRPFVDGAAVIITVSDQAIGAVAGAMAPFLGGADVVAHCSGSLPSTVLTDAGVRAPVVSVHPLLSVADPHEAVGRFADVAWTIEGSSTACWWARGWLARIEVDPTVIAPAAKTLYHAAAVTSAGLVVAVLDVAFELAELAGLGEDDARRMLLPLARSAIDNLANESPERALTGPAARRDEATIAAHYAAITDPSTREIYRVLTERARRLGRR